MFQIEFKDLRHYWYSYITMTSRNSFFKLTPDVSSQLVTDVAVQSDRRKLRRWDHRTNDSKEDAFSREDRCF